MNIFDIFDEYWLHQYIYDYYYEPFCLTFEISRDTLNLHLPINSPYSYCCIFWDSDYSSYETNILSKLISHKYDKNGIYKIF